MLKSVQQEIAQHSEKASGLITFGLLGTDVDTLSTFCKSSEQLRVVIHCCPVVETAKFLGSTSESEVSKMWVDKRHSKCIDVLTYCRKYMFHLAAAHETLHASLLSASQANAEFPVVAACFHLASAL